MIKRGPRKSVLQLSGQKLIGDLMIYYSAQLNSAAIAKL